jgi:RNA polymerase sigma factor (sigma-70 family)
MPTRAESDADGGDSSGRPLEVERRQLSNLAYRLLGSLADAEDVVQETYARWYAMTPSERDAIDVPTAWLSKVAGRICLDLLRSARVRREKYVGQWLPEPLPDGTDWAGGAHTPAATTPVDPADRVTLDESISMAFLVVLESMTPAERVAFILHDVFRYPFADIAEIVGRTPEACRQLASSARRRIRRADPRSRPQLGAPTSSESSNRHGRPRTSPPWSLFSTPTARWWLMAGGRPPLRSTRSMARDRSRTSLPTSSTGPPP